MVAQAHVLIVEDNRDQAESVRAVLESSLDVQFVCEIAGDLKSAVARLKQGGVEIVLLDLTLPDSHGDRYGTITAIKAAKAAESVRIVVLTGWGGEEIMEPAKAAGASEVLHKPADPAKLQTALEWEVIHQKREQNRSEVVKSFEEASDIVSRLVELIKSAPLPAKIKEATP